MLDTEALRCGCGWPVLGNAARGIYSTAVLFQIDLNLDHFVPAAKMQLAQQQLQPATSLVEVLQKLKIQAGPDTISNDFRASSCATKNASLVSPAQDDRH